jgi:hypothetical protein
MNFREIRVGREKNALLRMVVVQVRKNNLLEETATRLLILISEANKINSSFNILKPFNNLEL